MAVNKDKPHLFVLPEDDADRELANGFHLHVAWDKYRQMQVLKPAGGWAEVLKVFEDEHASAMERYPTRSMVLLIDFDGNETRLQRAQAVIPADLADRVFVLGALTDPEELRAQLGSYETIGKALADDCHHQTNVTWNHALLRHNSSELNRLRQHVRPLLF